MTAHNRRGSGEGSIYQRADNGLWVGTVNLGWRDGKRVRSSYYGKTRREVHEKLQRALRASEDGLTVRADRMTVAAYLRQWLEDVEPVVRASTIRRYRQLVGVHLIPALGRTRLPDMTPDAVERMMRAMVDRGGSPRSANHARAVLRTALANAARNGLVVRNVAALARALRVEHRQVTSLDPAQVSRLLQAVRGDRLETLYVLAIGSGLRQGELLGLRWSDIDLQVGTLTVRHALQRIDGEYRLVETKTARSRRTVSLPAVAVQALQRLRETSRQREVVPLTDYVFTTRSGAALDGSNVTKWLKGHLAMAGLPDVSFHALRHTAASLLLAQGVHPRVVMEILGHSQISLTMNTYSHVIPALQAEAAERMNALLTAN